MSIEEEWYRIMDETDDDYLFPPKEFEIIDDSDRDKLVLDPPPYY